MQYMVIGNINGEKLRESDKYIQIRVEDRDALAGGAYVIFNKETKRIKDIDFRARYWSNERWEKLHEVAVCG